MPPGGHFGRIVEATFRPGKGGDCIGESGGRTGSVRHQRMDGVSLNRVPSQ